jgi:hypothetical protein
MVILLLRIKRILDMLLTEYRKNIRTSEKFLQSSVADIMTGLRELKPYIARKDTDESFGKDV